MFNETDDPSLSCVSGPENVYLHHVLRHGWDFMEFLFGSQRIISLIAPHEVELALRLLTRMRSDGVRPAAAHYTCLGLSQIRAQERLS